MDGADLIVSGGTGGVYTNRINWNKYAQCLTKFKITLPYQQVDNTSTSTGPAIGTKTLNTAESLRRSFLGIALSTTGASEGKITLQAGNTTADGFVGAVTSGTTAVIVAGDELVFIFERNGNTYTGTLTNITQSYSRNLSYTAIPPSGPSQSINNMGNFAIWILGGTQNIHSFKIESDTLKNPNAIFIGDSITSGFFATSYTGKFADQVAFNKGWSFEVLAGPSDYVVGYNDTKARDFFGLFTPGRFLVMTGGNDLFFGYSLSTVQSNYTVFINYLKSRGASVVHLLATPRNNIDLTAWNAWLVSNYGSTDLVIDTYTPLKGAGTGISPTYDNGDGVHPNQAGHNLIASTIISAL